MHACSLNRLLRRTKHLTRTKSWNEQPWGWEAIGRYYKQAAHRPPIAVLMATLPKPNGGERQICLLGMFTRLQGRCRADIAREWGASACQHWGKAIAG
eukprot:8421791-Alexandrium_andersonii.AAC.1